MKATQEQYNALKQVVSKVIADAGGKQKIVANYETAIQEGKIKIIKSLETRIIWDLFHTACRVEPSLRDSFKELNDSHIETAMKKIWAFA